MELQTLYTIIQLVGILILGIELFYVLNQKPSKLQKMLVIVFINLLISFFTYLIELQAPTIEVAYAGCLLGYIGKPFAFLTMFFILAEYASIHIPKGIKVAIILYFVALTGTVFLDPFFHWYYGTELSFNPTAMGSRIEVGHEFFWYLYMASTFTVFIAYVVVVAYEFKYSKTKQAKEMTFYLLCTVLFSIIGLILFIANLTNGYETTLLGTIFGSICLLILFTRYHIFDSMSSALNKTLDESDNGFLIVDARGCISYYNKVIEQFVPEIKRSLSHKQNEKIIFSMEKYKQQPIILSNGKVYSFKVYDFTAGEYNDRFVGRTYKFDDITESYGYQERLHQDVLAATSRLKTIQKDILLSFANLIEARDGYTGQHVKNVATISKAISIELRKLPKYADYIDDEYIRIIELASPLHDVGKIKIPDSILGKPGKLTPEEFEIMKQHTIYGEDIVKHTLIDVEDLENINMTKDIALYHHERWDGTGYPFGLSNEQIPLSARIVAVADVYDALRMERPYKKAFDKDVSIKIIKEESGTHFDPEIVDSFLRIVDEL